MSSEAVEETVKKDTRLICQYGDKCYRKNPFHLAKYKHPRSKKEEHSKKKEVPTGTKRKSDDVDEDDAEVTGDYTQTKILKTDLSSSVELRKASSPSNDDSCEEAVTTDSTVKEDKPVVTSTDEKETEKSSESRPDSVESNVENDNMESNVESDSNKIYKIDSDPSMIRKAIRELFLTEMPEDFYQFYEFCQSISKDNPPKVLKPVKLEIVGPYDILTRKLSSFLLNDKEKYLRHWRYYYDTPEFQTVIKCDDKDGLHFGYWRDEASEKPVFVAKNKANVNCIIQDVAPNIFGAVNFHIEDKIKSANPFEKNSIINLQRKLKQFAKENNISLEKNSSEMHKREKHVVARTFHKTGIVVPYDKKTQVGYRELSVADNVLHKIIKSIEESTTPEERQKPLTELEEVIRLATIAADECDFGTCLELAHDLFTSGCPYLQKKTLQLFSTAYTHLQRPEFLQIAKAHLQDRRRGSELSVL